LSIFSFHSENWDFEAVFLPFPARALRVWEDQAARRGRFKMKRGAPADGLARLFDFSPTG
jgi:hypothetical protein